VSARLLLAAASVLALALPATAQDMAITNATVALGDGSEPIEGATVIVRGGRVVSAGAGVAVPAGMTAVDGSGMWVTPGLFASITNLGLADVDAVDESSDISASGSPFSAALDVSTAINPAAQDIAISRAGGVTRASVTPEAGSSIFAGQGALIDLRVGRTPVTSPRAFQLIELGERGAQLAGGSRTSAHALLRNALLEARSFGEEAQLIGTSPRDPLQTGDDVPINPAGGARGMRETDVLLTRFDAAALVPVVTGRQQLYVRVQRASDILAALELTEVFPDLDLVLVGATEGWMVADAIAAAGVPVIAAALNDLPQSFERLAATQSNIGRMVDAGVTVAIGGYESSGDHPRSLPQYAGNLVAVGRMPGAAGLTWGEALASITSVPAQIAGMAEGTGTLAAGAPGDVVLWDGDPLELSSAPVRVFIEGVEQSMDNHQTRLRDRYRSLDESEMPRGMVR
jgi:imidazolonepropionase-like amidohydrolase